MEQFWAVWCRLDTENGKKGEYVLATKSLFREFIKAKEYSLTIAPGREPLVGEVTLELKSALNNARVDKICEESWENST